MVPGRKGRQAWLDSTLERVRVSGDGNGARCTRSGHYGRGLTGGLAITHAEQSGSATRAIQIGPGIRNAAATMATRTAALAADLRFGLGADRLSFGPVVSFDYASGSLKRFAETGAGALNLTSDGSADAWTR